MIVVDSSAVLDALVGDQPDPRLAHRLGNDELHAPHLLDVEVLHALRVLVTRGAATAERIEAGRADFEEMRITRYPHTPLRGRIWQLRHNLSAYDATYVALAEELQVPFVTADDRIAAAPGVRATIDVYSHRPPRRS